MMDFVSVHSHTTLSHGDGFGSPEEHVERVADLGMEALALTEHGNVSSIVKLHQAAVRHNIKPIYGIEAYTGPANMREIKATYKWHQVILAADLTGYQNLMRLVERSWSTEGFYSRPTVSWKMLRDHAEGLVVTSGCADSLLSYALDGGGRGHTTGSFDKGLAVASQYRNLFGDRYYLEVQRFPELERTRRLNPQLAEISRRLGIPLVATADVHHPFQEQTKMRAVLHAASRNTGTVEAAEAAWEYDVPGAYPCSDDEVIRALQGTGLTLAQAHGALESTGQIAGRCNVRLPVMSRVVYPFAEEGAASEEALIRRWMSDGWRLRGCSQWTPERQREALQRAEEELTAFRDKGFISYFLMISDLVRWAKRQGIAVGPGRGSSAASFVMYLLQITEINSLNYPLALFERFVAPDRYDLPDVDIDVESARRDEVRRYAEAKYGTEMVGNVGTLSYYRGRAAIDKIGKVFEIPFLATKKIKDLLVDDELGAAGGTVAKTRELFPVVADLFAKHPNLAYAEQLEGQVSGLGVHAAGIVVGSEPLSRFVSTYAKHDVGKDHKDVQVLSVDKYDGEDLGLLKIDLLGLKTMDIIATAAKAVGMTMDQVYTLPLDDPEVLAMFRSGVLGGAFQFEGGTTRDICIEVQPETFMDLAAINSLSRPGPLAGGSTNAFIRSRQGQLVRDELPPALEALLGETEGEIAYQEQVIALAGTVGGFDPVQRSKVRTIISKKKGKAAFDEYRPLFLEGAERAGFDGELAELLWSKMITAGGYAFNVAHAVSYSVLASWTMWFRVHHPLEFFYARLLANVDASKDSKTKQHPTQKILKDMAASTDLKVLSVDPVLSGVDWTVEDGALRPGLRQIKGIGEKQARDMVAWRTSRMAAAQRIDEMRPELPMPPMVSWEAFLAVSGIGQVKIQNMVDFAEHPDPFEIGKIARNTRAIAEWITSGECDDPNMVAPTKVSTDIPYPEQRWDGVMCGVVLDVTYRDLFESHRNRTGKKLDPTTVTDPHLRTSCSLFCEDVRGYFRITVNRFNFPKWKARIDGARPEIDYILARVGKSERFPGKTVFANDLWTIVPDEE